MEVRSWPWNAREAKVSKTFQAPGAWVAAATGALPAGAGGGRPDLCFPRGRLQLASCCLPFYAIFTFYLSFLKKQYKITTCSVI